MFGDNDVICFLGDSITAWGYYMAEVYQVLRKKYKIKCYNIGTPGGRAYMAEGCLYSRCLIFNPDYVFVMFGINDIEHTHYRKWYPELLDEELKKKAIDIYEESVDSIVKKIIAFGAKPILGIPAPYDEVSDVPAENLYNQARLDMAIERLYKIAEKYGCPTVDFKSVMQPMLGDRQVISPDRVHPTLEGYHVMAQVFLHDTFEQESMDFDTPFAFEEWNRLRYEAEQKMRSFNFAEYCAMYDDNWAKGKSTEEKKKAASELYAQSHDKESFAAESFRDYADNLDAKDKLIEDILKLTIF